MPNQENINMESMLKVGTILHGTYRIDSYLSSGGFGNTYVATHINFNEKYAIKEFFMKGVNERDGNNTTVSVSNNEKVIEFNEQLEKFKWYHLAAIVAVPCVYIAGQCGWILAEVGRQPWAIQGLLPTSAAVSSLSVGNVIITTMIFAVLFTALLVAEIRIMCNAINNQK